MADIDSHKPLIERLARKNILVIDDDGMITKTLCDLLHRAGFYADAAADGASGIDKTEKSDFDLIISDIRMPNIDGVQMVKRIKEIAKLKSRPDTPIIFITGYTDDKAVAEAKRLGEVIFKPFETKEFLERIKKYI
ncbi:MAG: response regulator [Candidatus Omnitrophica bacterium]|nr:response regulator [Candidatus Omnitrophota bacterium]